MRTFQELYDFMQQFDGRELSIRKKGPMHKYHLHVLRNGSTAIISGPAILAERIDNVRIDRVYMFRIQFKDGGKVAFNDIDDHSKDIAMTYEIDISNNINIIDEFPQIVRKGVVELLQNLRDDAYELLPLGGKLPPRPKKPRKTKEQERRVVGRKLAKKEEKENKKKSFSNIEKRIK